MPTARAPEVSDGASARLGRDELSPHLAQARTAPKSVMFPQRQVGAGLARADQTQPQSLRDWRESGGAVQRTTNQARS